MIGNRLDPYEVTARLGAGGHLVTNWMRTLDLQGERQ